MVLFRAGIALSEGSTVSYIFGIRDSPSSAGALRRIFMLGGRFFSRRFETPAALLKETP
jgi:hypothetical protein